MRSDSGLLWLSVFSTYFNPRSYMRSDILFPSKLIGITKISIHAPTWGATSSGTFSTDTRIYFNPRSYMRSDCDFSWKADIQWQFQSTLLHEERPGVIICSGYAILFQSTLLHEERQTGFLFLFSSVFISIHAPTWGATRKILFGLQHRIISIHAPTWGATSILMNSWLAQLKFQSTLLHEERLFLLVLKPKSEKISIHAPTWGATPILGTTSCHLLFQSTLLHEERRFKPQVRSCVQKISIHAPTWGATSETRRPACNISLFQSTLLHEERRHLSLSDRPPHHISIHAPTWGATLLGRWGMRFLF